MPRYVKTFDMSTGKSYGHLIDGLGVSGLKFNLANNQSTPQDVTGFIADPTKIKEFSVKCVVVRHHTNEYIRTFEFRGFYKTSDSTWYVGESDYMGDDFGLLGVELSMTSGGQLQYTTTNHSGALVKSYIKFL